MIVATLLRRARAFPSLLHLLITPKGATAAINLCELVGADNGSELPRIAVGEFLSLVRGSGNPAPPYIKLHAQIAGPGMGSVAELAGLSAIVAARQPALILEFGTHRGFSTWHLLANAGPDAKILTIDLPAGMVVQGSTDVGLQGPSERPFLPRNERIQLIEMDSRQWVPKTSVPVDMCFIDAGHSYECVKNDTNKALQVMAPGGVMVWHDAAWRRDGYGVNRYLRELVAEGRPVNHLVIGPHDYSGLAAMIV